MNYNFKSITLCPSLFPILPGDPTDTDYTAVGCAITTISSNLTEMSKGVKLLAALMEDEVGSGQNLMGAARTLTGAVSDLLRAVEPASGEVTNANTKPLDPITSNPPITHCCLQADLIMNSLSCVFPSWFAERSHNLFTCLACARQGNCSGVQSG